MPQDVSQLSDAELLAIVGGAQPQASPRPQASRTAARQPQAYTGPLPTDASAVFPHLVMQESGGRAGVLGPQTRYGRAQGRTQMLPDTARETAQRLGVPWRPEMMTGTTPEAAAYQDQLGLAYLQQGLQTTGNMRDALRYYHGGPNRALWGPKTNAYAEEVLGRVGSGQGAPVQAAGASASPDVSSLPDEELLALANAPAPSQPQQAASPPRGGNIIDALRKPWMTRDPIRIDPPQPVQYDENGNEIVVISNGIGRNPDGTFTVPEALADGSTATYRLSADEFARWQSQRDNERELNAEEQARRQDPAYQREYAAARARSENVPAFVENLVQGGTLGAVPLIEGALGWLDPNTQGVGRGLASQAARDASRDRQQQLLQDDPAGTVGTQILGGLLTPGLKGTGDWIGAAQGSERLARAGLVGAGTGALAGAISGEGDLAARGGDAVLGGLTGFGVGAVGQGALDRVLRPAAARAAARGPSNARILSREGVQLTPGQMMSEVPIVGPMARSLEEGASSIPFVGSPIAGARQQSVETFNRAAINRALAPIDERLPRNIPMGYQAIEEAQGRLGAAYDEVLPRVSARVDDQFDLDLSALSARAQTDLTPPLAQQFDNIVQQRLFGNIPDNEVIPGEAFKRIESEVGAMSREYRTDLDPQNRALSRLLDDTQEVVRDLIARQNPDEAARIRDINRGYANLVRVEDAAASTASQQTQGVFSPTQLGMAVRRGSSRSQSARGDALMQDLAVAGRDIIPSRVGDSGTATRGAITGGLAAMASGVPVAGTVAIPVIATSVAYSRPAQSLLNAIYRATDGGSAAASLAELARFAQRNPALLPYYEAAAQHALSLGSPQSQASPQAPQSLPRAMPGQ